MHVEKQKKNCHNFLKNICGKRGQKGQNVKQKQNKKKETITHPFLKEKVEWGMIPYVQAMLLARYLRGDLDSYPVFLWK